MNNNEILELKRMRFPQITSLKQVCRNALNELTEQFIFVKRRMSPTQDFITQTYNELEIARIEKTSKYIATRLNYMN